ncbi:Subtilisin-like protease SBT1.7, partial [Clarias magur]
AEGSSEPVPVVCVELHESEVGVPPEPVLSPISQRVRRHRHPQRLLTHTHTHTHRH